jgi:quercetin dioxygenase-like cupin family protein
MSEGATVRAESGTHARIGDDGQELVVLATAADTGGEYLEVEALLPAGSPRSPERVLSGHEVRIEVLDGRLRVEAGGAERALRAGEALSIPAGTPHRFGVSGTGHGARFVWRIRPAPADDGVLEEFFGLGNGN